MPGNVGDVLKRALLLRESLYQLLSALAAARRVSGKLLEGLNGEYARIKYPLLVVPSQNKELRWAWGGGYDLCTPLREIVLSTGLFLISKKLDRIRECSAPQCSWIYLDATRNRSRLWCESAVCGNRERVRRHYHAHH